MSKVIEFMKKELVLVISFALAVVSMFFVSPNGSYIDYIDYRTLALLFCLMTIMAGLNRLGVFKLCAEKLINIAHTIRGVTIILVLLSFFASMVITNDVTLITFVPFTIILLNMSGKRDKLFYVVTLETISANLGSMATPVGNPQNLYLFSAYNMDLKSFLTAIIPYCVLSLVLLMIASIFVGNSSVKCGEYKSEDKCENLNYRLILMYGLLFVVALLCVFKVINYIVFLGALVALVVVFDRATLLKVDYSLLFTFVFLFVFIGNLGNIQTVHNFLQEIIKGNEVMVGVLSSQVFSNVPAAILLSGFTSNGSGLLVGVNIGGLGTLIASMASLISFKFVQNEDVKTSKYIVIFTLLNIVFLAINLLMYLLIG